MPAYDFMAPTMDAPDPTVRRAALKVQLGQGLDRSELDRLGTRMMLEQDAASGADAPNSALGRRNFDFNGRPLMSTPAAGGGDGVTAPVDYSASSVLAWLKGSRIDPGRADLERRAGETQIAATQHAMRDADIRRQMESERLGLETRRLDRADAQDQQERGAVQAATSPNAGLAQQIMEGRGFGGLDPSAPADRSVVYAGAGGANPSMFRALEPRPVFAPSFTPADMMGGPSGGMVFRTSPESAQFVPGPKSKGRGDQPEYSEDGKFYRSGPEDEWKPVPQSQTDKPLRPNEWFMAGRPGGNYVEYRKQFDREMADFQKSQESSAGTPLKPSASTQSPAGKTPFYNHADVLAEMKRRGLTK